jgi:transposase
MQNLGLINVEEMIAPQHPLRKIKSLVDEVLRQMSPQFSEMYAQEGRRSIPPERLLKAKVLQALFTIRSDRQLCARLQTDLMFRWFLDLNLDEAIFDASTFSHNQARLLDHAVAEVFFHEVVELARAGGWVSDDHFSVDGTLIEAWASMKSFRPKGELPPEAEKNQGQDFRGEKRSNETHASTTDPEARLLKKSAGAAAKLCLGAHAVMENRHGLCVLFNVRSGVGEPEPQVAVEQIKQLQERGFTPKTVGGDKGYHTQEFVTGLRETGVEAHPAIRADRDLMGVVVDAAHAVSLTIRKRIEEVFGWTKTTGGFRKSRYRGVERTQAAGQYVVASLNLLRLAKLETSRA